jgi:hypothetical protein
VTEIAAKFASAMSGFWWALDERERRLLVMALCLIGWALVSVPVERQRRSRERAELAAEVAAQLRGER